MAVGIEQSERRRGRGAQSTPSGRYEPLARIAFDDGWQTLEELPPFKTEVPVEPPRTIITRNKSPDISFDRSINPYRGCEHGCVYCFARPTHAYLGLSPGLDFESKLFAKPDARRSCWSRELSAPGYEPRTIAIGTNTDPYQPIERQYRIMRAILEVLERAGHPVGIVTKSALVLRDIDILARMAERELAKVALSVTTLDPKLARTMEPRAATPARRLEAIAAVRGRRSGLGDGGAGHPGAQRPRDRAHPRCRRGRRRARRRATCCCGCRSRCATVPRMAAGQLSRPLPARDVADPRDARRQGLRFEWGKRMKGAGPYAWQIGRRFEIACERLGLNGTACACWPPSISGRRARAPSS